MPITPTVSPLARILRTALQLAVALPLLVPAIVAVLHAAGVESVNEAGLLALAAVALTVVVAVQNFAERAGLIPTIGAGTTPLIPAVEAVNIIDRHASGPRIRDAQREIREAAEGGGRR